MRDRCLVLRPGALGDTILTVPAFELLSREFEDLRLVLASSPAGCRVGRLSGFFADTCPYESPDLSALFVDGLSRERLFRDVAALVAFGAGGAGEIAERARDAGVPLAISVDTWPAPGRGHVAAQLLQRAADALGLDPAEALVSVNARSPMPRDDFSTPEGALHLPPLRVGRDEAVWSARPGQRIAIAPGGGSPAKCWPADRFAETCRLLLESHRVHLMLVLGPAEMEHPEIVSAFGNLPCTVSECWSVQDLAATMAACDLYIGNDSGLSHLAAWAGAEVIALFGPTDPELWAPLGHVSVLDMRTTDPAKLAEAARRSLDWKN